MSDYLKIIGNCLPLTREAEIAAWERGDTDLLANSQLPYVVRIASKLCHGYKFDDLELAISAGNMGLMEALKSYDARVARLTTYATASIRWKIQNEIRREIRGIGPSHIVKKSTGHKKPDSISGRERAIDLPYWESLDLDLADDVRLLVEAMQTLDERERFVMERIMQGDSRAEIGRSLNLSREWARQVEAKAIVKLRMFFKECGHAAVCGE